MTGDDLAALAGTTATVLHIAQPTQVGQVVVAAKEGEPSRTARIRGGSQLVDPGWWAVHIGADGLAELVAAEPPYPEQSQ